MIRPIATVLFLLVMVLQAGAQVRLAPARAHDCAAPCQEIAVIFIHGLTGSDETWVNRESQQSFPKLLAEDNDLKNRLDVYALSYQSLWNEGPPIVEVTKALALEVDRLIAAKRYGKIVFVAHSLGGNIASEYLAHVKLRFGHAALSRFRLLITLGTPFDGSSLAGIAGLFSGNEQIRSLLAIQKNDFLQLLHSTQEDYLNKRIDNQCAAIEFDAGYETLPVGTTIVVDKSSATRGATRTREFARNHTDLPKPRDADDPVFLWVKEELALCIAGRERCAEATQPKPICATGDFPERPM